MHPHQQKRCDKSMRRDSGDCLPKQSASQTLRGGLFSHEGRMNS